MQDFDVFLTVESVKLYDYSRDPKYNKVLVKASNAPRVGPMDEPRRSTGEELVSLHFIVPPRYAPVAGDRLRVTIEAAAATPPEVPIASPED